MSRVPRTIRTLARIRDLKSRQQRKPMIRRNMSRLDGLVTLILATSPQLAASQRSKARRRNEADRARAAGEAEVDVFDFRSTRAGVVGRDVGVAFVAEGVGFWWWEGRELEGDVVLRAVAEQRVQV